MRLILSAVMVFGLASNAFAAETVVATVKGMVCDFCARSLEATLGAREGVEAVSVDLNAKTVTVRLADGATLDDPTLKQLVTDAGYDVANIVRETTP